MNSEQILTAAITTVINGILAALIRYFEKKHLNKKNASNNNNTTGEQK